MTVAVMLECWFFWNQLREAGIIGFPHRLDPVWLAVSTILQVSNVMPAGGIDRRLKKNFHCILAHVWWAVYSNFSSIFSSTLAWLYGRQCSGGNPLPASVCMKFTLVFATEDCGASSVREENQKEQNTLFIDNYD